MECGRLESFCRGNRDKTSCTLCDPKIRQRFWSLKSSTRTGVLLHRLPGGGIEDDETLEQAVRHELNEELGFILTQIQCVDAIDHTWSWKGREIRERAWIFVADSCHDPRLSNGETPEIEEADGRCYGTVWRSLDDTAQGLPPLCPATSFELLRTAKAGHLREATPIRLGSHAPSIQCWSAEFVVGSSARK